MKYYEFRLERGSPEFRKYVTPFIRKEHRSFPNGSNYMTEVLTPSPCGVMFHVLRMEGVGEGTDFGIYFCDRDQVISRVLMTVAVPETPEELIEHAAAVSA